MLFQEDTNDFEKDLQESPESEGEIEGEEAVSSTSDYESVDIGDHEFIECQKEAERWREKCMRVTADLENMNRRMAQERESWIRSAQTSIFNDLLGVVDNFERALSEQDERGGKDTFAEGVTLIYKELLSLLDRSGVKEIIETQTFDPELHEALVQVDSDKHESGAIVDVLQKGYRFKNRVLRPAKVSVAK